MIKPYSSVFVVGFHRSLTSALSRLLHRSGLQMGHYLMPPAVSNPEGHFEDVPLVDLHDRLLALNGADWRFHDQSKLNPAIRLDLLERYVERRSRTAIGPWGAKDPRACLFVPAWRRVLGDEGRYLVLLRHWSGSVQSLYRRHSEALAKGEGSADVNASFWRQPELAARMWLTYHRRLLPLLEECREQCLVVTQQSLLGGLPVIEKLNERFGLALDVTTRAPFRRSLSHDRIEEGVRRRLSPHLIDELEGLWGELLQKVNYKAENEAPSWVQEVDSAPDITERLLEWAEAIRAKPAQPTSSKPPEGLQQQLKLVAEDSRLPLDVEHWRARIEAEARLVPECWEYLARARMLRGDALGAEQDLAKVLLCGKSQPYLFMLLGECREAELDDEGAEHCYRQAIARNDANAIFHVRLANLWVAQGRYGEAMAHLQGALGRHPAKPPLIHALANVFDQQGDTQRAIKWLKEATDNNPNVPPLLARQLRSLQMKMDPEGSHPASGGAEAKIMDEPGRVQALISALAAVDDGLARRDLARRVAGVWLRLGLAYPVTNGSLPQP